MRTEIAEGVRFLRHHRVLRACLVAVGFSNLGAGGLQAIEVVFLVRTVHLHAGVVGLLLSITSLGGLAGAVLARRLVGLLGDGRTLVVALLVEAISAFVVPVTAPGWRLGLFCVGVGVSNVATVAFNVVAGSYRQEVIPARLTGRVIAASRMVTWGAVPLGALGAGALAAQIGLRSALWVLAATLVLAPLSFVVAGIATVRDLPRDLPGDRAGDLLLDLPG